MLLSKPCCTMLPCTVLLAQQKPGCFVFQMILKYKKPSADKLGLRIGALNVNGLCETPKQKLVLDRMLEDAVDILILIDARLKNNEVRDSTILGNLESFVTEPINELQNTNKSRKRGVLILISPKADLKTNNFTPHWNGNLLEISIGSYECFINF